MTQQKHIPLGVGFYPDWWFNNYGISFGREYYYSPEYRVDAQAKMQKALYERFGDVGLGNAEPEPKPLITFGMPLLPAVFGCEVVFEDAAIPWAMPANLSKEDCDKLIKPDLATVSPMKEILDQVAYLKSRYGKVVGDINVTGVQNLALKLRGEELYIDYFEDPDFCHRLLTFCTECMIDLWQLIYPITGTGALDVTPMCDPTIFCVPNCTVEQISGDTYAEFGLPYDNLLAGACHPFGIHHCGSLDAVVEQYAKVNNLVFVEAGFGTDFARARRILGPDVAFNARISPVAMKNNTPEEIEAVVKETIDQGAPLHNFSIDTVGLTDGVPDENVRMARKTAMEYGRLD
ncbi:MAG: uroporphyrinogen decarboxylase family protein [Desulfobacterales bacterium]|jgi:uroporphyrinogen-III decarboxylase